MTASAAKNLANTVLVALFVAGHTMTRSDFAELDDRLFEALLSSEDSEAQRVLNIAAEHLEDIRSERIRSRTLDPA